MKNRILLLLIILSTCVSRQVVAQVNVNVNIGSQPIWGPVGYDYVDYYYLPDLDMYYNVPQRRWIYLQNSKWVVSPSLPASYRNYDLYNAYKVVINEQKPYLRHDVYRARYSSYKGRHDQQFIRDSRDEKYYVIKNHPHHNEWKGNGKGEWKGIDHVWHGSKDQHGYKNKDYGNGNYPTANENNSAGNSVNTNHSESKPNSPGHSNGNGRKAANRGRK